MSNDDTCVCHFRQNMNVSMLTYAGPWKNNVFKKNM